MSVVRAGWKRVVQVRPYESETLELSVEREYDEINGPAQMSVIELARSLAERGDALVAERLAARVAAAAPQRLLDSRADAGAVATRALKAARVESESDPLML